MDSGVKSRTLNQNPCSGPQNWNLGAMTKALMTLTQVLWDPQFLIMGQEFSPFQYSPTPSVSAWQCHRCHFLQFHLLGEPWTCVSSSVPGTISCCFCLNCLGGPCTWFITSPGVHISISVCPALVLQDSVQAGEPGLWLRPPLAHLAMGQLSPSSS